MTPANNIKAAATSLVGIKPARAPMAPPPIPPDTSLALSDLVPAGHGPIVVPVMALPIATTSNATQPPSVKASVNTIGKRSQITTFTIPAGQTFPLSAYGNRFQILQSTCPVPVRYDNTAGFSTYSPGLGLAICTETDFALLEFQNPLNFPITVTVFFGWDEQTAIVHPDQVVSVTEGFLAFNGSSQNFGTSPNANLVIGGVTVLNGSQGPLGNLYFRRGYFYGIQLTLFTPPQTANANAAYIGRSARMMDTIPQGGWVEYDAPQGQLYNLANFWVKGNGAGNDGVYFQLT